MSAIVFYDGVCGLCNRFVQFALPRDRRDRLRFAALQGETAAKTLVPRGIDLQDLDTVYLLVGDELFKKGRAIGRCLQLLGGWWAIPAALLAILPRALVDWGYDFVARRRYRLFGRYDTCPVPAPGQRAKFLP